MESLAPPYLHALSDNETALLRKIFRTAKDAKGATYFQQQDFMGKGGDIRNFLSDAPVVRPSPKLIAQLYNFALTDMRKNAQANEEIAKMIDDLYEMGMKSNRYDRDIKVYMDTFINGDMESYNAGSDEIGIFVGFRYLNNSNKIIRFLVHIFFDEKISRSRFLCYFKLGSSPRETKGFAYSAHGTVYLSGFINKSIGCEFFSLRTVLDSHIKSGILITTLSGGMPVAKQCVLINARRLALGFDLPDNLNIPIEENHHIFEMMNVFSIDDCKCNLHEFDKPILDSLIIKDKIISIRDGTEQLRLES